jgi:cobalamin biosynthetic protein CobC
MRGRLSGDAVRLDALLQGAGWRIIGGTRLFRLAAHSEARAAFDRLLNAGVLTRPFSDVSDWLRFGIPCHENAWERLAAAVRG